MDTPILTSNGWSTMGEVRVGDQVHAPDGTLTEIVATSDVEGNEDCYQLTFAAGQQIVAGARHQWWVFDRWGSNGRKGPKGKWRIRTTEEIAATYRIGKRATHNERRYSVEIPEPLQRLPSIQPIDPYVLGVWLGDGATAGAIITSDDPEIFAAIEAAGYPTTPGARYGRGVLGLRRPLRLLGVLGRKHIPMPYLLGSAEQRLALLRGLMDTDGSVMLTGPLAIPRCEFMSINRDLARDVLFLARSLGWKATLRTGRATLNGRDICEKYRVCWTAHQGHRAPFRLPRKLARLAQQPTKATRSRSNQIVDVRRVDRRPLRCIQVAHPSHCYLVADGLVPTHNSEILSGAAIYLLVGDDEESSEVYGAAKDTKQAGKVFEPALRMVQLSPTLTRVISTHSTRCCTAALIRT